MTFFVLTSSQSSGPQTASLVLSGLQAKKATLWLYLSRLLANLSVIDSGSKSKMLTYLSLPPEANLRPSGENRQYLKIEHFWPLVFFFNFEKRLTRLPHSGQSKPVWFHRGNRLLSRYDPWSNRTDLGGLKSRDFWDYGGGNDQSGILPIGLVKSAAFWAATSLMQEWRPAAYALGLSVLEHLWLWILDEIWSLWQSHLDLRASSMKTIRGHELGYALVQIFLIGGPGKNKSLSWNPWFITDW